MDFVPIVTQVATRRCGRWARTLPFESVLPRRAGPALRRRPRTKRRPRKWFGRGLAGLAQTAKETGVTTRDASAQARTPMVFERGASPRAQGVCCEALGPLVWGLGSHRPSGARWDSREKLHTTVPRASGLR